MSGANVVLRADIGGHQYTMGLRHNRDVLARTSTDSQGRFDFRSVPIPPRFDVQIEQLKRGTGGVQLVAWAEGHGLVWSDVPQLSNPEPVRLVLRPEVQVAGIVRDPRGNGLAGVRVAAHSFTRAAAAALTLRGDDDGSLNLSLSEVSLDTVSDADGRFVLRSLPRELRIGISLQADDRHRQYGYLDTGSEPGPKEVLFEYGEPRVLPVFRSPIECVLVPTRDIVIKVVDHEGQPVDGGAVQGIDSQRHFAGSAAVKQGACRLPFRKAGRVIFSYGSDPLQPRLCGSVQAEVKAEGTPPIEIRLPPPRWLEGRVVDADTDKGVVGVYVRYAQTSDDPAGLLAANSLSVSGAEGKFTLPVAPGSGVVSFYFLPVHGYFPPTFGNLRDREQSLPDLPISVPETGDSEPVKLVLSRGLAVRGVVRDNSGQPVAGAMVRAQNGDGGYRRQSTTTDGEGKFTLWGLSPHLAANLIAFTGNGGALETIAAEPQQPWDRTRGVEQVLTLQPGVALFGRVLYAGRPRAGVRMKVSRLMGDQYFDWCDLVTDAEGMYRVAGLVAGDRYSFEVVDPNGLVALDWHHQRPYSQQVPEGKLEVELPEVQLVSRGQTLRGVVVDPQGKPVPGITVSAGLSGGRILSRPSTGPPPWTKTDKDGAFALESLPDEPIELMAFRANPQGGTIRFPAKVRPGLNQQDVRILLDPTLTDEIEDLDAPRKP